MKKSCTVHTATYHACTINHALFLAHIYGTHACTCTQSPEKACAMNYSITTFPCMCMHALIMDAMQTSVHVVCLQATGACKMNRG